MTHDKGWLIVVRISVKVLTTLKIFKELVP